MPRRCSGCPAEIGPSASKFRTTQTRIGSRRNCSCAWWYDVYDCESYTSPQTTSPPRTSKTRTAKTTAMARYGRMARKVRRNCEVLEVGDSSTMVHFVHLTRRDWMTP